MKNLLTAILILSLAHSEDVYPQFSDINKQIEFGRKRIEITDYFEQGYEIKKNTNREVLSIKVNNENIDLIEFFNYIGMHELTDELHIKFPNYDYLNEQTFFIPEHAIIRYIGGFTQILSYGLTGSIGIALLLIGESTIENEKYIELSITLIASTGLFYSSRKITNWTKTLQYKSKIVEYVTEIKLLSKQQIKDIAESYNLNLYNNLKN